MRIVVAALLALLAGSVTAADFAPVVPGGALRFPRDTGAHPRHRIEWWYVTGQLDGPAGPRGFQVTFFRLRNPGAEGGRSRFSPAQMLFAHAALSDPKQGRLMGDQRSARMLAPLVSASEETTDLRLDDWTLRRDGADYVTTVPAADFTLELRLAPTQPVMLQGDAGFSRKGAGTAQASYYYSEPQLRVSGRVTRAGRSDEVTGTAWLDHEWSSALLAADAVGWDWLGANLDDGGALMAFRIRDKQGGTLWTTATRRGKPEDTPRTFTGADVSFEPLRTWTSPRTGTRYPVAMRVRVGGDTWELKPLLDDQELDARASTGTLYWEGAVGLASATASGGRGYLELTGYAARLAFP